ncbi:MAG TPA: HD domain-containing phosphohydrolase [Gemmatimonadales bacterium]
MARPLVVAASAVPRSLPLGRRATDIEARLVSSLPAAAEIDLDRPTVVLLDRALVDGVPELSHRLEELAGVAALVWVGAPGEIAPTSDVPVELLTSFIPGSAPTATAAALLRGALRHAVSLRATRMARRDADERLAELADLARVGAALGTERDLARLLELVLDQARRLTCSDAGSIYLVERPEDDDADGSRRLRFVLTQNDTIPDIAFGEFTIPVDRTSLAGYAAATGEVLDIPDVYRVEGESYRLNSSFDERLGYRTRSVLVIPLETHRREIVGVLQLINRKRDASARLASMADVEREVVPYDRRAVELARALAAHAAVAIENARLYESIERLFEGFVTASVTAIESRDPTTSGHSARVATLTVALAEALQHGGLGQYRGRRFTREQLRELRYAALLHDFGKVGVREEVLVKGKKLYPAELERIRQRLHRIAQAEETAFERGRAEHLLRHGREGYDALVGRLEARRDERVGQLRRLFAAVEAANEPTLLPEERAAELERMAAETCPPGPDGSALPLLGCAELTALRVRQGTLGERERREIEEHVTHSWRFLSQIPWTPELRNVPEIAYGHHEKLNGMGYPRGLTAERIPVQVRMMTIADIYDALTATDRPYKKAVAPERALEILRREADAGELDRDLLTTFTEAAVFRLTAQASG